MDSSSETGEGPSAETLSRTLDALGDLVCVVGAGGTVEYCNDRCRTVTGDAGDEPVDRVSELVADADEQSLLDTVETVLADGDPRTVEAAVAAADDESTLHEFTVRPLDGDDGDRAVCIGRHGAKGETRSHAHIAEEYETVFENAQDAIFLVDVETGPEGEPTFRYSRINRSLEVVSGLESEATRGKTPRELLGEDAGDAVEARYRECWEREETISYEETLPMPDGRITWHTRLSPVVVDGEVRQLVGVARDVTDRGHRRRELERYERIIENVPIGVFRTTPGPEGTFEFVNDGLVDLFDAPSKEVLFKTPVREFYADPEERERFSERLLEQGTVVDEEIHFRTLDGADLWGALTAIVVEEDGERYFDGALQDVTERKRYEQRIEEQMEELEVLNRIVRHDIRNDMTVVLGMAETAREDVDDPDIRQRLDTVLRNAEHAVELTRTARDLMESMLSESRELKPVPLARVLDDELDTVDDNYDRAIVRVAGEIPRVDVVADDLLESVFRNVLKNAVQHNDKDVPEVEVSVTEGDDTVAVSVADNGPGIPDAQKESVFGKGEKGLDSEGTGIGLYLVGSLVDSYGGDVTIEDNDPEGTVFTVELQKAE